VIFCGQGVDPGVADAVGVIVMDDIGELAEYVEQM
jgi:hypothetical protein